MSRRCTLLRESPSKRDCCTAQDGLYASWLYRYVEASLYCHCETDS